MLSCINFFYNNGTIFAQKPLSSFLEIPTTWKLSPILFDHFPYKKPIINVSES